MATIEELLLTAVSIARSAGQLAKEKWSQPLEMTSKGFRDIVTDADIAVQKLITDAIRAEFPDHGFLTEEEDSDLPATGSIIWVIDPIDGTTSYSHNLPLFCVSIAAISSFGEQLVGVVYDPMRDEMFTAIRGKGAWLNGRSLQVSQIDNLDDAVLALDWAGAPALRLRTLNALCQLGVRVRTIRAIGTAALAMSWLAAGRLDCFFNLNIKPWDVAAATLIVLEAGGKATYPDGNPMLWASVDDGVVVSNGRFHDELCEYIDSK